jgi:hypothetical protein
MRRHYGAVSPAYVKRFTFATFFEIGRTVAHPLADREQLQQIPASEVALRAFFAAVQHRVSPSSASSPTAGASSGVLGLLVGVEQS